MSKKYIFTLTGINIEKIEQKYGFTSNSHFEEIIPDNVTKIDDLDSSKKDTIYSFLDESKSLKKCNVSSIIFKGDKKYKCFWDRNYIPEGIKPIGCPIRYIPDKCTKSYFSEMTKDKYKISENISEKRSFEIACRNDKRLSVEHRGIYETDGIFCSFNCCLAFIENERRDPLYRYSKTLLYQMYKEVNDKELKDEIIPAPHWRTLSEFGGNLSIEQFRDTFNKIEYLGHGLISMVSLGRLYEDKFKF